MVCNHEATREATVFGETAGEKDLKPSDFVHQNKTITAKGTNSFCDFCAFLWLNSCTSAAIVEYLDALPHARVDAVSVKPVLSEQ